MKDPAASRRLRSVPADGPERTQPTAEGAARVESLDALLREVDDLRLSLETDLTLAAAALDSGEAEVAAGILGSDIDNVHTFEDRALGHLSALSCEPAAPAQRSSRWLSRASAAPFVAAAAVVGLLIGVVPSTLGTHSTSIAPSTVSAQSSLERLTALAAQGRTSQVRDASITFHEQINQLVAQSKDNPAAAQQALLLLSYERFAIVQSGDGAALHDVLAASTAIATRISRSLPAALRTAVPAAPALAAAPAGTSSPKPKPRRTTASKPSASPTPSPTASPRASSSPKASPTASPTPSPSPTATASAPAGPYPYPMPTAPTPGRTLS